MTSKKMQCYVKSVKTDTSSILEDLKPAIISFLIKFSILIGVMFSLAILFTIITYGEPYIKAAFEVINSLFTVMLSIVFVTQYNAYLVIMIILDVVIFLCVREMMVNTNVDSRDRLPYSQTLFSIMFLFLLFAFNGILVILSWGSTKPELVVGWSFMLCETIINMIVVVVGILLYRAYLKCENKIMPAKPSDWDSLSED
jgi:hypothetical protein